MGLVKARVIADELGCSESKVFEMAARGELPCVRFPLGPGDNRAAVRFDLETVRDWIKKHSRGLVPEVKDDGTTRR